jgi:hypothetical protein
VKTTISDRTTPCPLDQVNRQFPGPEQALALRLHLCRDLCRLRLCRFRHRRLCPSHRRLAGEQDRACRLRSRCLRTEQALHDRRPVHGGGPLSQNPALPQRAGETHKG